jgi:hypothetical protein
MNQSTAEIVREYGAFPGVEHVHGVTYDGENVWFAAGDKLIAIDPASGKTLRRRSVGRTCPNHWRKRTYHQHARSDAETANPAEQINETKRGSVLGLVHSVRRHLFAAIWCASGGEASNLVLSFASMLKVVFEFMVKDRC